MARADLLRSRRGSVMVEFVIYAPFLILIWSGVIWMYELNMARIGSQRQARSCAWSYAHGGCRGPAPAGCELRGLSEVDDAELHQESGSFREVASVLPFLRPTMERLHGDRASFAAQRSANEPNPSSATNRVQGRHTMMCNERSDRPEWTLDEVFQRTCRQVLGSWCP